MNSYVLAVCGPITVLILGLIARGVSNIGKEQTDQAKVIAGMSVDMSYIKTTVESLHRFRNSLQEQEVKDLREALKEARENV